MRRTFLKSMLALLAAPLAATAAGNAVVNVYKSPTCGCCRLWIDHLRAHGFDVIAHDTGNNGMRARLGVPAELGSCHTAVVDGYVIEGHVPAREVSRLLRERPDALGLAVPGMPLGSPGMEGPRTDPYDVLLVSRNGATRVCQSYR